jgi:putative FmdB family regulatory protein
MPTYEYACQKCGHEFEHFQSMRDEPLKKCPKCKKAGLKRLVGSGAGLIFKGTGFYITDYKNKPDGKKDGGGEKQGGDKQGGEKKGGEKPSAGEGKPAESKSTPSESKPAASSSPSKPSSESGRK